MSRKNTEARWQSNNKCFSSHINGHFWLSLASSPNTGEVLFLRKAKRSFALFREVREWFCVGKANRAVCGYFQELAQQARPLWSGRKDFLKCWPGANVKGNWLCAQRPVSFPCWLLCWMVFYSLCISPLQHVR